MNMSIASVFSVITDTKNLFKVKGLIKNIKVKCVIDSGASHSVISKHIVDEYNLPVGNEKIKLLTAIETESIGTKQKI